MAVLFILKSKPMLILKKIILLLLTSVLYASFSLADNMLGITKPVHDVKLSLPVGGIIAKTQIKEGESVKKGDELLRLDDRLHNHEVNRRSVILKDNSKLNTSLHNKEILKSLLDNTNKLYVLNRSISEEELKKLTMQYTSLAGDASTLAADKKREEIEYNMAKEELEQRILRSPINGIITDVDAEVGEWAEPGKMVIRVVDTSKIFLEVNIDLAELHKQNLQQNSKVDIEFNDGIALKGQGTVIFVSPIVDTSSSLVKVNIEYDNKDGKVLPGITARLLPSESKSTTQ
jgi:RND family efflux transporter MFP subunit